MIKIKPTRLFNTIKSNKASFVHRLPIALVLFALMLSPFAALAQTAELTIEDVAVDENVVGGTVEITVELSSAISEEVTARVTSTGGSAVSGTDYTAVDETLTFASNDITSTFNITITDDEIVESTETFTVSILSVSTTGITFTDTATVRITDNDGNAELTIAGVTVNETDSTAVLTVTLTKELGADLTMDVGFVPGGTATAIDDYTAPGTSLTINEGAMTGTISVPIVDDSIVESTETFTVTVSSPEGDLASRVEGLPASATVMIADNDTATLTIANVSVNEDAGNAVLTLELDKSISEELIVLVDTIAGTAEATDYTVLTDTAREITFSIGSTRETVSVAIADDRIVESTETFTVAVSHDAAGSFDDRVILPTNPATVTINANDSAMMTFTETNVTVTEEDSAELTVQLDNPLAASLTMTVGITPDTAVAADYTAPGTFLTIDEGNTTGTISVPIFNDSIVEGDETFTVTVSSLTGAQAGSVTLQMAVATVTINDTDEAMVTIERAAFTVPESVVNAEIAATLNNPVDGNLTVNVVIVDDTAVSEQDYTVPANAALTFTGNDNAFNERQFLDIPITDDDIADSTETFTVTYELVDNRGGRITLNRDMTTVTISDNDSVGITLSPSGPVRITEAEDPSTATYTVALTSEPIGGDVTIQIDSINTATDTDNDVTVDPSTLIFTAANWRTAQTVTITAAADDDAVNDSANLTHTATGADYTGTDATLPVAVEDPETARIIFSRTSITMDENAQASYTVELDTQPTAEVTVAIAISNNDIALDSQTLTFNPTGNSNLWSTAQTVTITEADDADAVDDSATLTHTATGGDYSTANSGNPVSGLVTVAVEDPETAGIIFSRTSITMDENAQASYTVKLDTQPIAVVTVAIVSSNPDVAVDKPSLTFTTTDWDDEQTVTITEANDADAVDDTANLTHTATGGDYSTANVDNPGSPVSGLVTVNVTDPETAGISFNSINPPSEDIDSIEIDEGTNNRAYTVVLDTQPTADVIVAIVISNSDVTVEPSSLTFSATTIDHWRTTQTVTITAAHDDDAVDESAILTHTATGGDYTTANVSRELSVTVDDDDTAGIRLNPGSITMDENAQASYTVVLDTEPTATVTVTIESDNDDAITVTPTTLTFNPTSNHWRTPQTVTITAEEDDDAVDDSADLMHTASGGDYGNVTAVLTVNVDDDDIAGISFNFDPAIGVSMNEEDRQPYTVDYTVVLDTEPTDQVTVAIVSSNISMNSSNDVTVNRSSLTFDQTSWSTPQPVMITAAHDADAVDENAILTHIATGGDYGDNNVTAILPVTVNDDEMAGITFNPGSITMDENARVSYTVILDSQPTADVTVAIGIRNSDVKLLDSQPLTFTPDDWDDVQTVTITGANDADAVNDSATLTHTATGGDYGTENVTAELPVTVTDPETAGIIFTPASVTVDEGTTRTYTVELDTEPFGGDVTVTIARIDEDNSMGRLTISPSAELTFTTATWNVARSVTVDPGSQDDDDDGYMQMFRHTAAAGDGDYDGLTADLTVTVNDTDTISRDNRLSGLTISANGPVLDSNLNSYQFNPDITDYALIINNAGIPTDSTSTYIMVTATLSDDPDPDLASATAELISDETVLYRIDSGTDQEIDEEVVNLEPGRNDLQIVVTAEDNSSRTYAITIARIDQVVLNDVKLVAGTDCNVAPVAAVIAGNSYSACVERFPMDTAGTVLFTILQPDTPTTLLDTLDMVRNLLTNNTIGTDSSYTVDSIIVVPSPLTYLMMTVFLDGTRVYEVRYPITNETMERTDMDNDGIPDTVEMMRNAPDFSTNLVITDRAATTMRQIVVSDGQRILLGDYARRAASAGLASGGLTYTAELRLSTTELGSIGIPMPDGYDDEGIYDFVVYLPINEDVASIVILLASPLEADRDYVKYNGDTWVPFDDSEDNYYSAAPRDITNGTCPMPPPPVPSIPDPDDWTPGLNMGHSCMLLRISDGGLNDADRDPNAAERIRNGIVVDPGAIVTSDEDDPSGSGASDLWFILLLTLINLAVFILRRKQIASTQRK